jgi:uncharacterized damage-inducible protein DinB
MMQTDTAMQLADYNAWADRTLFESIGTLPADEVHRARTTLFGSMLGTLNHIYQVGLIWQANLLGKAHGFTSRRDVLHPRFDDLVAAQMDLDGWLVDWASAQTPETLAERLDFTFVSGKAATMPRGSMLLHLVTHGSYHRGWVCEMFFDSGAKPPQIDLSVFLCET